MDEAQRAAVGQVYPVALFSEPSSTPNIVDIQTINDERNVVVKIYLLSDGEGELSDQVIVDSSALSSVPTTLHLRKVFSSLTGFSAKLEWDADTDDELIHLPAGEKHQDFSRFGGIPNPKSTGSTGDITITTTGFSVAGDEGSITLELTKQ